MTLVVQVGAAVCFLALVARFAYEVKSSVLRDGLALLAGAGTVAAVGAAERALGGSWFDVLDAVFYWGAGAGMTVHTIRSVRSERVPTRR
ncbi:hypothetical protein [Streptomyces klenkii]|uniref:hypothetical protein n=1 Tax=Streptomyces klenkii TaxID=1420899 RepID=UPI003428BCAE